MSYGNYPDHKKIQKILVIKLRHLGDVLLTTPVFSALKRRLPHAEVDAYVYLESKPLLENNPYLTEVLSYDRSVKKKGFLKKMLYELSLLRQIRRQNYDLVINLTEGDRGVMAAKASKALCRVGVDSKKNSVFTHIVKNCPQRHMVEKNLDAVRRIGIFPESHERKLYFFVPENLPSDRLEHIPIDDFLLIHPTSRWRFKCWPPAKMRRLVQRLLDEGQNIVITSGRDLIEKQMVDTIVKDIRSDRLFNVSGKINLQELGFLIKHTKGLVCMDSLPFHMSSVFKTPVVALFGPTSEITWGPWQNPNAKIVTKKMSCRPCYQDGCGGSKMSDCLFSIEVDEVYAALAEIGVFERRVSLKG